MFLNGVIEGWKIVPSNGVISLQSMKIWSHVPENCATLLYMVAIDQTGIVRTMVKSQFVIAEPCAVTLAQVRQVVVVDHRWVSPHNLYMDTHETGEKLEAICAFLTEYTEILYAWFDLVA